MHPSPSNRRITITLPFPPSTNAYWRNVRGQMLISAKGRAYRAEVIGVVLVARMKLMLSGRLHVRLSLHPPDLRRRDVDNFSKALLDALTHAGVWLDDSQIDLMTVIRKPPNRKNGRAIIRIKEV